MLRLNDLIGISELSSSTQQLVNEAGTAGEKCGSAASIFRDWSQFKLRVSDELRTKGRISNAKKFDAVAQEYMEDFFRQFNEADAYEKSKQFSISNYEEMYNKSLANYYKESKKYKKAMKAAQKAVCKDPKSTSYLYDMFTTEANTSKNTFRNIKKLYNDARGITRIKKFAAAGLTVGFLAGAVYAGVKVYRTIFKSDDISQEKNKKAVGYENSDNVKADLAAVGISDPKSLEQKVVDAKNTPDVFYKFDTIRTTQKTVKHSENKELSKAETNTNIENLYMNQKKQISMGENPLAKTNEQNSKQIVKENSVAQAKEPAKEQKTAMSAEEKAEARKAFDKAINQVRQYITADGVTSEDYKVVAGDSFWRISKKILKAFGEENPDNRQIIKMIALLAELNDIDSVTGYMLRPNDIIVVPAVSEPEIYETESVEENEFGDTEGNQEYKTLDTIFNSTEMESIDFDEIYREFIKASR